MTGGEVIALCPGDLSLPATPPTLKERNVRLARLAGLISSAPCSCLISTDPECKDTLVEKVRPESLLSQPCPPALWGI